jgi:magnesium-transporting ATPase (P-type)
MARGHLWWSGARRLTSVDRGLQTEEDWMSGTSEAEVLTSTSPASSPQYYSQPPRAVVEQLGSDEGTGLTAAEAATRLTRYGPNQITSEKPPSIWAVALGQLRDPMNIMLVAVAIVSLPSARSRPRCSSPVSSCSTSCWGPARS